MKKIFCFVLSLVMALMLFSCSERITVNKAKEEEKVEEESSEEEIGEEIEEIPLYDAISEEKLVSIQVENETGSFLYYRGADDQFCFKGLEKYVCDDVSEEESDTSVLKMFALSMTANQKLTDAEELSTYGLHGRGAATITVTYKDENGIGRERVVIIGDETPLAKGSFYAKMDGEDSVYVLGLSSSVEWLFQGVEEYLLPQVAFSVSGIEDLTIQKNGTTFLSIEKEEDGFRLVSPEGGTINEEKLSVVLETLSYFVGERVAEYDLMGRYFNLPDGQQALATLFRNYCLSDENLKWAFAISYSFEGASTNLFISSPVEKNGKTVYYVYSSDFDVIAEFDKARIPWVSWEIADYLK